MPVARPDIGQDTVASAQLPVPSDRSSSDHDHDGVAYPDKSLPVHDLDHSYFPEYSAACTSSVSCPNGIVMHGRLVKHKSFWEKIGCSSFTLSVIENGYFLPFVSSPTRYFAQNHASCFKHSNFVSEAIDALICAHCVVRLQESDLVVCSPLGVVEQKKLRLILDLRELNKHLLAPKFKYEDISTLRHMFEVGEHFFSFDLKSAYHHINIDPRYYKYLGFSWDGQYYAFTSLPFGLCTAPSVFTKITRDLVHWWRRSGWKVFMYLDDGAGAAPTHDDAMQLAISVRNDLIDSGFLISEKSRFQPSHAAWGYAWFLC